MMERLTAMQKQYDELQSQLEESRMSPSRQPAASGRLLDSSPNCRASAQRCRVCDEYLAVQRQLEEERTASRSSDDTTAVKQLLGPNGYSSTSTTRVGFVAATAGRDPSPTRGCRPAVTETGRRWLAETVTRAAALPRTAHRRGAYIPRWDTTVALTSTVGDQARRRSSLLRWSSDCSAVGSHPRVSGVSMSEAEHRRLLSESELAVLADEDQLECWWTTEHHFLDEYSHISANEVLLPWVGARTERLHVGSGIFNITPPVNHPARVATARRDALITSRTAASRFWYQCGSSTTEQRELQHKRIPTSPKPCSTKSSSGIPQDVGRRGVQPTARTSLDAHPQPVLPKPYDEAPPADVGRRQQPGTFEEGRQDGPRRVVFTVGSPPPASRRSSRLQEHDRRCRTRG